MKNLVASLLLISVSAFAEKPKTMVTFPQEAWYNIHDGAKKIGYLFSRFEWTDSSQTKVRYSSTLIRKTEGVWFEEQLQEVVMADLKPLSLRYRQASNGGEKFISIDISGGKASSEKKESGKVEKKTFDIPEGGVFGSFVNFSFLSLKAQMKPTQEYSILVLDEGDFTLKDCGLSLINALEFGLNCASQKGVFKVNASGLIETQTVPGTQLMIKKTDMKSAQKGFPKPGERK